MLFWERKRMKAVEAREAAGESLWTDQIDEQVRRKIGFGWEAAMSGAYTQRGVFDNHMKMLFKAHGFGVYAVDPDHLIRLTETDFILTHVEAVYRSLKQAGLNNRLFESVVNRAFNDHRIAFRMVDGEVVPLASDELHVEVVEPALRLLVDSRFQKAHDAYVKALKEISNNDAGDAITDAGTALQETLTVLGCKGNALGPLIKDAKKNGLFTGHDQNLIDGITKFMDWASADRSESGDGHKHSKAEVADAWLMVHIVGAIIVRLADPALRGEPSGA